MWLGFCSKIILKFNILKHKEPVELTAYTKLKYFWDKVRVSGIGSLGASTESVVYTRLVVCTEPEVKRKLADMLLVGEAVNTPRGEHKILVNVR